MHHSPAKTALRQSSVVSRIKWRTVTDAHVKFKGPRLARSARASVRPRWRGGLKMSSAQIWSLDTFKGL